MTLVQRSRLATPDPAHRPTKSANLRGLNTVLHTHHGTVNPAAVALMEERVNSLLGQLGVMRSTLRRRDEELADARRDAAYHQHQERMHLKEIERIQAAGAEFPKQHQALKEEIAHLKQKLRNAAQQTSIASKTVFAEQTKSVQLSAEVARMQALIDASDLGTRESLQRQADAAGIRIMALEAQISDTAANHAVIQKTLTYDNTHLRARVLQLRRQNEDYKLLLESLDQGIRDRDRQIASLAIYRHGAMHRKVICKKCQQDQEEQVKLKQQQDAVEALPVPDMPVVTLATSTTVKLTCMAPAFSPAWHQLVVQYRVVGSEKEFSERVLMENPMGTPTPSPYHVRGPRANTTNPDPAVEVELSDLRPGASYQFQLLTRNNKTIGHLSAAANLLVDELPAGTSQVFPSQASRSDTVDLLFYAPLTLRASPVHAFHIYGSNEPDMKDATRLDTVAADVLTPNADGMLRYEFTQGRPNTDYYFQVSAVNRMGEGPRSDPSDRVRIDTAPPPPRHILVHRAGPRAAMIRVTSTPFPGSAITHYVIALQAESGTTESRSAVAKPDGSASLLWTEVPAASLTVHARAQNACGTGPETTWTVADLEQLLPIPVIRLDPCGPTKALLQLIAAPEHGSTVDTLVRYDVRLSTRPDMARATHVVTSRDVQEPTYTIMDLDPTQSYFVDVIYRRADEESLPCPPHQVLTSAAVVLPPSRPPNAGHDEPEPVALASRIHCVALAPAVAVRIHAPLHALAEHPLIARRSAAAVGLACGFWIALKPRLESAVVQELATIASNCTG
ncbi:hypothetical protein CAUPRSCDRAFT_11577 [Caulochytrium protostelioides]|uniref:Fibronectin type-III domain-containing protein n=1 Tax=Caulochytrium protostelioides TaxID=1555241 RepID=A0A4P9WTV0_9FUNG|nr:hypothetical protein CAUPRSCDRAFT_11577 [Caulochytrium protostelioides]